MAPSRPIALLAVASLAAVLLPPASARAEGHVVLKGGPYFPTETNAVNAVTQVDFGKFPTKWTAELGVGGYWGIFGLQVSAGYLTTGNQAADLKAIPLIAVARLRLPILDIIAPYVEGGAGATVSIADFGALANGTGTKTKVGFEAVAGGGVDVYLGPLLVGAELRYIWLKPTFDIPNSTQELNLSGITLTGVVGLRF